MNFRLARVSGLLFFSGACALIYQTAWFRELRLIFGASTASSAAVLAIFMGGLGLGGAILGSRADRAKNPLAMYANLELAVAVTSAVTPLLVQVAQRIYIGTGGITTLGPLGATVVRLLLSVVVLAGPAILMGGTLPAAARAVERASDVGRQRVAMLYGINTFGAVAGAVAANFLLMEVFGSRMTLWIACLVNALVAMVARSLSRSPELAPAGEAVAEETAPADTEDANTSPTFVSWFPPVAAAISGGTFMLMELVWYRMLGPILGGSSYTFGLILAVALAGIGLGGALYARTKIRPTLTIFAITCALEGLAIAIPYALGDRIAVLALLLRPLCSTGFAASILAWTVVAMIVVFPAAVVSGAQFPVVIGLYGRGDRSVGRDVGAAYLANTLGAIVGSIAGGFGLLPALSSTTCWRLVVTVLVSTAVLALALEVKGVGRRALLRRPAASAVACGLLALFFAASLGPTAAWRHSGIGAGRADRRIAEPSEHTIPKFVRLNRGIIAWEEDGLESSVALGNADGYAFIVNGKSDGHAISDGPTQIMSGLIGALLHPDPKRAMVIGLGTGSTAGWLGAIPSMERVDVVELEPAILRVARDCSAVNHDVLDNPKVHVALGDAREALLTTPARYDIVFSEPSNPYRAGISSMYTEEFYRATAERLNPHGIFVQWVQGYEVDAWCVATTMVTLKQVFKEVSLWRTTGGDLLVIAQNDPAVIDVAKMRSRLAEEPYASATRSVWRTSSVEGVLAHVVANPAMAEAMVKYELGAVNHDDHNVLEFAFARSVGHHGSIDEDIAGFAMRLGADVPRTTEPVSERAIVEEKWLFQAAIRRPLFPAPASRPAAEQTFASFVEHFQAGRFPSSIRAWRKTPRREPRYAEKMMLADMAASVPRDPELTAFVESIEREGQREFLRAFIAMRDDDPIRAAVALERGFVLHRKDPWIPQSISEAALELAVYLSRRDPVIATRMFEALGSKFAAEAQRVIRLSARAKVGAAIDKKHCADAMHDLEPAPFYGDIIRLRADCYLATKDPLEAEALEDLRLMTKWHGAFAAGVDLPPRPASTPEPEPTPAATAHAGAGDAGDAAEAGAADAGDAGGAEGGR
ncbi:MAG: fused MFS/spermidine synthase [Labilithrix sp.]|nr:fused MFS/spermidine synthase [Labilithrix sp.]